MTLLAQIIRAHNIGILLQAFDASVGENWVEIKHTSGRMSVWLWWFKPMKSDGFTELGVRLGAMKVRLVAGIAARSSL